MSTDKIIPDRIVSFDDNSFIVSDGEAWAVETPTGTELAPLGFDDEDTVVMEQSQLDELLGIMPDEASILAARVEVVPRRNSRPELVFTLEQK